MEGYSVLIPAFQPDNKLVELVDNLCMLNIDVMVIDDGSGPDYADIFGKVSAYGVPVLHHAENKGKGAAIKTGIIALMKKDNIYGIVTADADGQHTINDIYHIISEMKEHPGILIIGSREFVGEVPLRSRLGNTITRIVFRFATGLKISDTQSGLRGLPRELFAPMSALKGNHYEYEMNVLLSLHYWGADYLEVPIETVYLKGNPSSHFDTLKDAVLIYGKILKFIASSLISFLIDYGAYILFGLFSLANPWMSYILSRLISSSVNYVFNKHIVFGSGGKDSFYKYYALVITVMLIGSFVVNLLTDIGVYSVLAKLIIDIPLFFINYKVQQKYIFKPISAKRQ